MEKKLLARDDENWKGYTLDDLRYERAVALARLEIQKEKLAMSASEMRSGVPGIAGGGILGKLMGSLNYLDYAILAFRTFRFVSKRFRSFRKK